MVSKNAIVIDSRILDRLFNEVDYFYALIDSTLPDNSLACRFALEDLSSIRSYFEDYLIPTK